ncbi:hypothetical protein [Xanthomarina gelatinilytica]|uniref:hypothetical protein n=1 Tax=Xanthomarina gelatinilytica TaxID=1137281 RepID=UPI003AA7EAD8
MEYIEKLKKYLTNIEGHLIHEHSEDNNSESVLFATAMQLSYSNEIGNKIASVILFHQTTIALMKKLIIRCNFLTQLLIFPNQLNFKKMKDDESYSAVFRTLENHISFLNKGKLINKIRDLNSLRTEIAHKMHNTDVDVYLNENTNNLQKRFDEIWSIYIESTRDLNKKINEAAKRDEVLKLIKNDE